jgi:glycosyltransferase involved in cell wall biosynthesis
MSRPKIHQLIVGAAQYDAITSMAVEIRETLSQHYESKIYAHHMGLDILPEFIRPLEEIGSGSTDDVLIYHLSFGIPFLTELVLSRPEKLVVFYHNVTPSSYYEQLLPEFAEALRYGKTEAGLLCEKAEIAIATSEYNSRELTLIGYDDVHVMPSGANPRRLDEVGLDLVFLSELERQFPDGFILFVSQVLPHKKVDHALEIVHLLRNVHRLNVGLVIAGPIRQPAYEFAIGSLRERLHNTHLLMTNGVTDSQLATLYRSCLCYIGTSRHEGLSVPPLEAMANRAPVVVLGAGAVPETVKSGGIVLPETTGVIKFAEVVAEVITNKSLRGQLRRRGTARLLEDFNKSSTEQLLKLVEKVVL